VFSLAATLNEDPRTNSNWRQHKSGCPFYRERWFPNNDVLAGEPMYQVFCMKDTPPVTSDEQTKCLQSQHQCWRLVEAAAKRREPRARRASRESAVGE
jgi:hypothetical protein